MTPNFTKFRPNKLTFRHSIGGSYIVTASEYEKSILPQMSIDPNNIWHACRGDNVQEILGAIRLLAVAQ